MLPACVSLRAIKVYFGGGPSLIMCICFSRQSLEAVILLCMAHLCLGIPTWQALHVTVVPVIAAVQSPQNHLATQLEVACTRSSPLDLGQRWCETQQFAVFPYLVIRLAPVCVD
jgi:hypothetical protein